MIKIMKYILSFFSLLFLQFNSYDLSEDGKFNEGQETGTLTANLYTSDDSTAVMDYLAYLMDSQGLIKLDSAFSGPSSNQVQFTDVPTPVEIEPHFVPEDYKVFNNFPNPFNPHTSIRYELPVPGNVQIGIYDIKGELVNMLDQGTRGTGQHEAVLNAKNNHGQQIAEGVYLGNVIVDGKPVGKTLKMIYLHDYVSSSGGSSSTSDNSKNDSTSVQTLNKPMSVDYIVRFVNLAGTTPQIIGTDYFITINSDTTINAYAPAQGISTATVDLQSLVEMLSGYIPGKYETVQLKRNGNVLQTKNTGDDGNVVFNNVTKFLTYTIQVLGDTASRPNINPKDTSFVLLGNTAIEINPELYLRPTELTNLENKVINEDEFPAEPRIHDLYTKGTGFDSLGYQVNPSALIYLIQNQSNPTLAPVIIDANQYTKLDDLLENGNGANIVTVRAISPNSTSADKGFSVVVNPMTDISGIVDSLFGQGGPLAGVQITYGSANAITDATGNYHFQVQPNSNPQTMILNKNGFYERRLSPFAPTGDMTVDANKVDESLNMGFVDETSRALSGGFQRFENQPTYYINTSPPNGGGTITQAEIDTVLSIINNDLPRFTDSTFQNFNIEMGTNPPAFGTPGYVRVEWDNTIPGLGEHGEYMDGDEIISAYTKLSSGSGRGTALQELSQNLGPRKDSNIVQSIFNDPNSNSFYLPVDLKLGKFLYNRALGNSTPDTDQ